LTNGYIFSDDSAWDYARFPATAHEFYDWYFIPQKAIDPAFGEWAEKCLTAISKNSDA
jgi:hypothetical protein